MAVVVRVEEVEGSVREEKLPARPMPTKFVPRQREVSTPFPATVASFFYLLVLFPDQYISKCANLMIH